VTWPVAKRIYSRYDEDLSLRKARNLLRVKELYDVKTTGSDKHLTKWRWRRPRISTLRHKSAVWVITKLRAVNHSSYFATLTSAMTIHCSCLESAHGDIVTIDNTTRWNACRILLRNYFIISAKEVMFLPDFVCLLVCLSLCQQDNPKSYGRIFLKFSGNVGNGKNYQWFNFGGDPEGILDSGSLWNFR